MRKFINKMIVGLCSVILLFTIAPLQSIAHSSLIQPQNSLTIINQVTSAITPGLLETQLHVTVSEKEQRISMLSMDLSEEHLSIESSVPSEGYPSMEALTEQAKYAE